MKKHIGLLLGIWGGSLHAQSALNNQGATIRIRANTHLRVEQGLIANSGTITNAGNLYLDRNFTQTASGSYVGASTGWLWFEGNAGQSIQSATALDIVRLKVQNGDRLQLLSDLTVSNSLDLSNNSKIELGAFQLIAPNTNLLNYGINAYIVTNGAGALRQTLAAGDIKEYPVGNARYNPVILLSNAGATDDFSVRVADALLSNGTGGSPETQNHVGRTWHISEGTAGGNNLDISLEWGAADELAGFDRALCGIKHWNGTAWDVPVYSAAANFSGRYSQTLAGQTGFSPFGVASAAGTFPIELLGVEAERLGFDRVGLRWATGSELNNAGFEIERMLESELEFSKIGFVAGQGNSSQLQSYQYTDGRASAQRSYYRLKQLDHDGSSSYSPVQVVRPQVLESAAVAFPNPSSGALYLNLQLAKAAEAHIEPLDPLGNLVWAQTQTAEPSQPMHIAGFESLPPAGYLLRVRLASGEVFTQKIAKI